MQTMHFYGSFWPPLTASTVTEATIPDAAHELKGEDTTHRCAHSGFRLRKKRDDRSGKGNRLASLIPTRLYAIAY